MMIICQYHTAAISSRATTRSISTPTCLSLLSPHELRSNLWSSGSRGLLLLTTEDFHWGVDSNCPSTQNNKNNLHIILEYNTVSSEARHLGLGLWQWKGQHINAETGPQWLRVCNICCELKLYHRLKLTCSSFHWAISVGFSQQLYLTSPWASARTIQMKRMSNCETFFRYRHTLNLDLTSCHSSPLNSNNFALASDSAH